MWFNRRPTILADLNAAMSGVEAVLREADQARDAGDPVSAADLYRSALDQAPERNDVKVQLGNMLKDIGQLGAAEALYREAQKADPDSSDICVQLGHVLKLTGQRAAALDQYRRAARIDPNSWAAVEELAEAGDTWQQQRRFDVQLRSKGAEAVMAVSRQLSDMRAALDRMAALLPDALAQTAFPVDLYGEYRMLYDVPEPGPSDPVRFTVLLLAGRETLAGLYAQIAALRAQRMVDDWSLLVLGSGAEQQRIVTRAAASDARIRWLETDPDAEATAEWTAARAVTAGWLLLLGQGAVLHPLALAWFGAAASLSSARAFVADEERCQPGRAGPERLAPLFRQVLDYDTLLEANVFGETIAVAADAFAAFSPQPPEGSVGRARSALLLGLSQAGLVGHVPYPLVSTEAEVRLSLPEHRRAVADHLAASGLGDRVAVPKGATGPTIWRPRDTRTPIAVIIPSRDNDEDLRKFVLTLRDTAAAPDMLRIVIAENGSGRSSARPLFEELAAKRYVTVVNGAQPFNWSGMNNKAVQATDAPYLVFANDDMTMVTEEWDTRLRGLLERDDVGAVGARLLYGDDTLQHAGILFGWKSKVIHDGLYEPATTPGPNRRWEVTRSVSAVTGAFLATRRSRFLEFGGFDADSLPLAYSDVDYALKLRRAGLKVLWTPSITLYHYESKTRGLDHADPEKKARNDAEARVMEERWGTELDQDPSVHPIWCPATLPFRLLAAPSSSRVLDHIRRTGSPKPWAAARRDDAVAARS